MAKLTAEMVSMIKGMLARGDSQMDVAVWFGINVGRVSEINTGFLAEWRKVEATHENLPPPGPYRLVEKEAVVVSAAEYGLMTELMQNMSTLLERYRSLLKGNEESCGGTQNVHDRSLR
jgi:hypothetical protein